MKRAVVTRHMEKLCSQITPLRFSSKTEVMKSKPPRLSFATIVGDSSRSHPVSMEADMNCPAQVARLFFAIVLVASVTSSAQVIELGPGDSIANNTQLPNGTTVNVNGGTIGLGVELIGGQLNINDGNVAIGANSQATGFNNINNTVNITGGSVGGFFQLRTASVLNLSGGVVESFGVLSNSTANITGGSVLIFPDIVSGVVNIRGGDVPSVRVFDGGTVNIFGTEFSLGGNPVTNIGIGETIEITSRNVQLTAVLEDGSDFGFFLDPVIVGLQPDAATFASTVLITRTEPVVETTPVTTFSPLRGIFAGGDVSALEISDDVDLSYNPGFVLSSLEAPVWLEFEGDLATDSPSALSFTTEVSANTTGLSQTTDLLDWSSNQFVEVDVRPTTFNVDSVVLINVSDQIFDFVEPGTGTVRARIGWRSTGFIILFPWTVNVDQVVWNSTE